MRGLLSTQQPRDIPPKFVEKGHPTSIRNDKIPRFPVSEGRRKIDDELRPSVLRHKLIIPKFLRFFQAIEVDELIQPSCPR